MHIDTKVKWLPILELTRDLYQGLQVCTMSFVFCYNPLMASPGVDFQVNLPGMRPRFWPVIPCNLQTSNRKYMLYTRRHLLKARG